MNVDFFSTEKFGYSGLPAPSLWPDFVDMLLNRRFIAQHLKPEEFVSSDKA